MKERALVIWDFETLHDAVMEIEYGPDFFNRFPVEGQPIVIDIPAIIEKVSQLSPNVINDALADWRYFGNYADALFQHAVKPVYLFPSDRSTGNYLGRYQHQLFNGNIDTESTSTLVVVGLTDKLLPLIEQAKGLITKVIGMGIPSSLTKQVEMECDTFINYLDVRTLAIHQQQAELGDQDRKNIIKTFEELTQRTGNEWIQRVRIKPALVSLDPEFDEKKFGYHSFSYFLDDLQDMLSCRHHPSQREPEYRLTQKFRSSPASQLSPDERRLKDKTILYSRIGAQQGLRLPDSQIMWVGVDIYASFLKDKEGFKNFRELDEECLKQLQVDLPHATMTDAKKVRQVLFKCFLFSPGDSERIGFRQDITTLEQVEDLYFDLMTSRIARKAPGTIDFEALSLAVTGEKNSAERLLKKYEQPETSME